MDPYGLYGPNGPIGPLGPAGPRDNFGAQARARGPSAQPEGLLILPGGLLSNFE